MKRLAFNGGEISPNMALRTDMDTYTRSCTTLTNWDVAATGGISRRTGMRHLTQALESPSILIPYTYSEKTTYLIELSETALLIRDPDSGTIVSEFYAADMEDANWTYPDLNQVTWLQINSLLLLCAPTTPVMQLKMDANGSFDLDLFTYSTPPWQTEDLQDTAATLHPTSIANTYTITYTYSDDTPEEEQNTTDPAPGDALRISYYTQQTEAFTKARDLKTSLIACTAITPESTYSPGDKLAWEGESTYEHYICTKDWTGANDYTTGYDSPANYKDNFDIAENLTGFDTIPPITALTSGNNYKKGDKLAIRRGYWHLYTCIRPFSASDYTSGCTNPADYPRHFMRGLPIGAPLPSGGKWQFYCSGTWYGSYSIIRNYTNGELTEAWEHLGESKSSIGSPLNESITGNEENEESWLRLLLTSVRYLGSDPAAGLPSDSCGNRLIAYPYRHNMQLTVQNDGLLKDTSPITIPLKTPLTTTDWSDGAFCARHGYPRLACLHESRLIFAATATQPQTIWLSRTDDLNNFGTGDLDTHGALLTMTTTTQAAICWMTSRGNVIMLGTEDAEWIIHNPSSSGPITPSSIRITNHGRIGSSHIPAIQANDRILYCERGAGRIYQYAYNYENDSYTSSDLTIFADHIAETEGGITGGAILKKPYCAICFTTASGKLLKMTYNTMHNVNAWHRYETAGHIESIAVLPHGNAADRLYLITERNGTRRLETIDEQSDYTDGAEKHPYVSTMETTALSAPDTPDSPRHSAPLQLYLATPLPAENLSISAGHGYTQRIDRTGILPTGWQDLIAPTGWNRAPYIGLRITGNTPCTILAIQTP